MVASFETILLLSLYSLVMDPISVTSKGDEYDSLLAAIVEPIQAVVSEQDLAIFPLNFDLPLSQEVW